MPLEETHFIVHPFKALVGGQKFWGGQKCGSTISLLNTLMKISILLHKMVEECYHLHVIVCLQLYITTMKIVISPLNILLHFKALISGQKL